MCVCVVCLWRRRRRDEIQVILVAIEGLDTEIPFSLDLCACHGITLNSSGACNWSWKDSSLLEEGSIPMSLICYLLMTSLFSKVEKCSLKEINAILQRLSLNTGLSVKKEKSGSFFSKKCHNKEELKSLLAIPEGYLSGPSPFCQLCHS